MARAFSTTHWPGSAINARRALSWLDSAADGGCGVQPFQDRVVAQLRKRITREAAQATGPILYLDDDFTVRESAQLCCQPPLPPG